MSSSQYPLDDGPGTPTPNRNHVPSTYAVEIPLPPSPTNFIPSQAGQNFWSQKNPTLDQSWEKLMKEVNRYDDDMVKNWKDEIDTLLVYAGLFSAVVTAFAIESYQWLTDDPADVTVALLTQISLQLSGTNTSQIQLLRNVPFQVEPSSVRINCFWFLSLIFSLTSGLFALLCKQWLREYRRDTPTRTQAEALGLRQLRSESLEKWGVPAFLAALPILLEAALLLFFAGLLDLLWARHPVPFALAVVAVGISTGLYFATTFLPSLTIPKADYGWTQVSYGFQFISPFRSPQSWAVYHLICKLLRPLLRIPSLDSLFTKAGLWIPIKYPAPDWSTFDLEVIRRFDENIFSLSENGAGTLKVYELRGLQWAVSMFRDSPSMIPHLQNVMSTLQPSVALSTVLNYWQMTMWSDVTSVDVMEALKDDAVFKDTITDGLGQYLFFARSPDIQHPALLSPNGVSLLYHQQFWMYIASSEATLLHLQRFQESISEFERSGVHQITKMRFFVPFPVADRLWTHPDPVIRRRSIFLLLVYAKSWKLYSTTKEDEDTFEPRFDERPAFILALARHLTRADCVSELLVSEEGQRFIRFIHDEIIRCQLYQPRDWWDTVKMRKMLVLEWNHAIERAAQELGQLPSERFPLIPDPLERAAGPSAALVMETVSEIRDDPSGLQPVPGSP